MKFLVIMNSFLPFVDNHENSEEIPGVVSLLPLLPKYRDVLGLTCRPLHSGLQLFMLCSLSSEGVGVAWAYFKVVVQQRRS